MAVEIMNLYKEIDDLIVLWKKRSTSGKAFLIFAFSLSIMSIGSLADTVFAFKGFIVEGLRFYREVTEPIRQIASSFLELKVTQIYQDLFVLALFFYGAMNKVEGVDSDEKEHNGIRWWVSLL